LQQNFFIMVLQKKYMLKISHIWTSATKAWTPTYND
jgi:hypothetical protein